MTLPDASPVPSQAPPSNRTILGIGLMLLGFLCFSFTDAIAKFLTHDLHPLQIVWFRQFGLLSVGLWLLASRGLPILRTKRPGLQISRGVVAAMSSTLFIFAITYVPLADAVAVSFVAPFMVTVLGALILREAVGLRRWTAVTVGFIATLIVIRPGLGLFHPAILLVIVAASLFAARQILSRILGPVDATHTTIAYTSLGSVAVLTVPAILFWHTPAGLQQAILLFLLAASAGAGEVLIIRALELAQAVTVAPLQYTMIVWSTTLGWLIFAQLPDGWTLVGAAVIMASGMYTLHRERLAAMRGGG
jgi:drug/metabolite transporter (DMT)-like permease